MRTMTRRSLVPRPTAQWAFDARNVSRDSQGTRHRRHRRHHRQRRHQETWQMAWPMAWLVAWLIRQACLLPGMFCIKRWTPCISSALLLCSRVFWVLVSVFCIKNVALHSEAFVFCSLATFSSCYTYSAYALKRTIMRTTLLHSTTGISDRNDYVVWAQPSSLAEDLEFLTTESVGAAQGFARTKRGWQVGRREVGQVGFADINMFHLCFHLCSHLWLLSVAGLQIQGIHPHSLTPRSRQMAWYCHVVCKGLA